MTKRTMTKRTMTKRTMTKLYESAQNNVTGLHERAERAEARILDLENVIEEVAGDLEALVATHHAADYRHTGSEYDCGRAVCHPLNHQISKLGAVLNDG